LLVWGGGAGGVGEMSKISFATLYLLNEQKTLQSYRNIARVSPLRGFGRR